MKKLVVALLIVGLVVPVSAYAVQRLFHFDGGIGVIPTTRVDQPATVGGIPSVTTNVVRGLQPPGQIWRIGRLTADINDDGRIAVDGRGLLLASGDSITTNATQSVRAVLFCGPAGSATRHDSGLVPLDPNGNFRIRDVLTPAPDVPCDTPVLLIVNPSDRWFAAAIPVR
jgi:hypothetical protein